MTQGSLFSDQNLQSRETLDHIYQEIFKEASLKFPGKAFIFGDGNRFSSVVFVGESPGLPDVETGKPFQGPVGQLLDKILAAIQLDRQRVYLTNVVKFVSSADEISADLLSFFTPYLFREIAVINPKLIVTLGNTPTKVFINSKDKISALRGRFYDFNGIKILPTFNPAYLLRDPSKKKEVWEDMKIAREFIDKLS